MIEFGIFSFANQAEALAKAAEWGWGHFDEDGEVPVWVRTPFVWCGYCETSAYSAPADYDENGVLISPAVPLDGRVRFMAWRDKTVALPEDCESYIECRWDEGSPPVLPTGAVCISPVISGGGL